MTVAVPAAAAATPPARGRRGLHLLPALTLLVMLGPALPEPHPSWMTRVAEEWVARYGVAE